MVLGEAQFIQVDDKEILDEEQPYSMLVWIPRYAYKITKGWHSSTTGTIDVVFIDTENKDKTGTERNGTYNGDNGTYSDYVVHPAFIYGSEQLEGFWVGKFETSNTECTTEESSGKYYGTDKTLQIKAGVTSWRSIGINNSYQVCVGMNSANNIYGLSTDDSVIDPHLIKNIEWGAVAYLSKSPYGKETEEVWINNNSNYVTGQAGDSVSASSSTGTNGYTTTNGQKASTTGNVYGVYDMSGGAHEYPAAYLDATGNPATDLENAPQQHKDVYTAGSDASERNLNYAETSNKYGDAIYETSNIETSAWYSDNSLFVFSNTTMVRGGACNDSTRAGIFNFYYDGGVGISWYTSFRVVLATF